jgi:hypothetical protein
VDNAIYHVGWICMRRRTTRFNASALINRYVDNNPSRVSFLAACPW